MKKRAIWIVLIGGAVVALGAGMAFGLVYRPSERDVRNDVYARICTLLTEKQLVRPSSMEMISILVTDPREMSKEAALERRAQKFMSGSRVADRVLKRVEEDYARARPFSNVDVYLTYSSLNRLGGATRGVSQCSYVEQPGFGNGPLSELTIVGIGDNTLNQGSPEWAGVTNSAGLFFDTVKVGFKDRLKYVLARTYPHR